MWKDDENIIFKADITKAQMTKPENCRFLHLCEVKVPSVYSVKKYGAKISDEYSNFKRCKTLLELPMMASKFEFVDDQNLVFYNAKFQSKYG